MTNATNALGSHSVTSDPFTRLDSQSWGERTGACAIHRAKPAHTNDMASVTMMSATRVQTMRTPLTAPRNMPSASTPMATPTPISSLRPSIWVAATMLVSAIIEAIDRSMPPEMTTMVWATVAKASGSTLMAWPWMPLAP